MSSWYLMRHQLRYGPYTWQELCEYVHPSDLVWGSTYVDWTPATNVPELLFSADVKNKDDSKAVHSSQQGEQKTDDQLISDDMLRGIFQHDKVNATKFYTVSDNVQINNVYKSNMEAIITQVRLDLGEFHYLSRGSIKQIFKGRFADIGKTLFFSYDDYLKYHEEPFPTPLSYLTCYIENCKIESDVPVNNDFSANDQIVVEKERLLEYYLSNHPNTASLQKDIVETECLYLARVKTCIDDLITEYNQRLSGLTESIDTAFLHDKEDRIRYKNDIAQHDNLLNEISKNEKMKLSPYFGRMDLRIDEESTVSIYIGYNYTWDKDRLLVYDWRSEIGNRYYIKNEVSFGYNGFDYNLILRRALNIENGYLKLFRDEYDAKHAKSQRESSKQITDTKDTYITDLFLLEVIRQKRNMPRITDIISTIQRQQNEIIRLKYNTHLVVQGCAGSGKTMILLHRISYLLFNNRNIKPEQITLISPNNIFSTEIGPLASELQVDKTKIYDMDTFLIEKLNEFDYSRQNIRKTADEKQYMNESEYNEEFRAYTNSEQYLQEIKNEYSVLMKSHIEFWITNFDKLSAIFLQFDRNISADRNTHKSLFRHIKDTAMFIRNKYSDIIIDSLKVLQTKKIPQNIAIELNRLMKAEQERNKQWNHIISGDTAAYVINEISRIIDKKTTFSFFQLRNKQNGYSEHFVELISFLNKIVGLSNNDLRLLRNLTSYAGKLPDDCDFLIDKLVLPLTQKVETRCKTQRNNKPNRNKVLTALVVAGFFSGRLEKSDTLICVDEGQIYSTVIYRVIKALNHNAAFNIYGDIEQVTRHDVAIENWDELKSLFEANVYKLEQNYRNSNNISEYVSEKLNIKMIPIGIEANDVRTISTEADLNKILHSDINNRRFAIIANNVIELDYIEHILKRSRIGYQRIDQNNTSVRPGIISLLVIKHARGLEFETVLVYGQSMNKNEKYIAYTRALSQLYVYTD